MHMNPDRAPAFAPAKKRLMSGIYAVALGLAFVAAAPAMAAPGDAPALAPGQLPPRPQSQVQPQTQPQSQSPALPPRQPQTQPQAQPQQAQPQAGQAAAPGQSLQRVQKTEILDQAAYERLRNNSGVTLQWLWSDKRGHLTARDDRDVVSLEGGQINGDRSVELRGEVVSISADRFTFRGTILILNAPDPGRRCERTGDYEFRATGKRKYWRLQQMEACGGLTDYVDIYY